MLTQISSSLELQEETFRCMRCGFCQSLCPIYRELKDERLYARGRMALIEAYAKGKIGLSPELRRRLYFCLECRWCESGCPSGVKISKINTALKEEAVRRGQLSWSKRLIFRHLLPANRRFELVVRFGRWFTHHLLGDLPQESWLRHLLPLLGLDPKRVLPPLAPHPLLTFSLGGLDPLNLTREGDYIYMERRESPLRLLYFPGCGAKYLYPNIISSTLQVLGAMGMSVWIPLDFLCCGAPVKASGDRATFNKLSSHNLSLFQRIEVDGIVTTCGTCGLTFKETYTQKMGLTLPIYDISQVLDRWGPPELEEMEALVTYHDPCHLSRGLGIWKEPRQMLTSIPGIRYVEMEEADSCCGCGGLFTLSHYAVAQKIRERKLEHIRHSQAQIVATGCPACIVHLSEGLSLSKDHIPILHPVELVARALKDTNKGNALGEAKLT